MNCLREMKIEKLEDQVDDVIQRLTLEEKLGIISGGHTENSFKETYSTIGNDGVVKLDFRGKYFPSGQLKSLEFTPVKFFDGPRGVLGNNCTCFPVSMARGASFDTSLEERIGDVAGKEIRVLGANYFGGVCINILRHPAGGRAQETYGEDMHHLGEMGAALVRGVQKHNVMACVKHYACNNIENTRFKVNIELADRTLHEVYLPHFKRCVEEGAASIMGAYNKVRGGYCCESKFLLDDILRSQWGFKGFTISDFGHGVHDAAKAINAGMDLEMPIQKHYYYHLPKALKTGKVHEGTIDNSVRRILTTALRRELTEDPVSYTKDLVACKAHVNLAREVAEKSMVLLKNNHALLPLNPKKIRKLALVGKLAEIENTGDRGSSHVSPPYVLTPHQGIKSALEEFDVQVATCFDNFDIESAMEISRDADAVIAFTGCTHRDEGEFYDAGQLNGKETTADYDETSLTKVGGDRKSIRFRDEDIRLIKEIANVNKNIVLVAIGGSAFIVEDVIESVNSILMAWYAGMEGGSALSNILFGVVNPSGKLPFTVPVDERDLPEMDSVSSEVFYGYYHGYMLLDKAHTKARFPFGYGLSYTNFTYKKASAAVIDGAIHTQVEVTNTGEYDGEEVVQVYVGAKK